MNKNIKTVRKNRIKEKPSPLRILTFVFLASYTLSLIFLLAWALLNSFKTDIEYMVSSWSFPKEIGFDNYIIAFENFGVQVTEENATRTVGFLEMCLNSFLFAGGCSLANVVTTMVTAYLTSKFDFKFSKLVYTVCFIALILPIIGNTPSQLLFARTFHLYDSIYGMWVMRANFLSTYYLVFFAFFSSIPKSYYEAAKIDGANNFQLFTKISFPFSWKLFMTVLILVFIGLWNDYETPTLWLPNHPVISVGLLEFTSATNSMISSIPLQIAGALIVSLPAFVVFFIFKDTLVGNITNGGIKE